MTSSQAAEQLPQLGGVWRMTLRYRVNDVGLAGQLFIEVFGAVLEPNTPPGACPKVHFGDLVAIDLDMCVKSNQTPLQLEVSDPISVIGELAMWCARNQCRLELYPVTNQPVWRVTMWDVLAFELHLRAPAADGEPTTEP